VCTTHCIKDVGGRTIRVTNETNVCVRFPSSVLHVILLDYVRRTCQRESNRDRRRPDTERTERVEEGVRAADRGYPTGRERENDGTRRGTG